MHPEIRAGKGRREGEGARKDKSRKLTAVAFEGCATKTKAQQNYIPRQRLESTEVFFYGEQKGGGGTVSQVESKTTF